MLKFSVKSPRQFFMMFRRLVCTMLTAMYNVKMAISLLSLSLLFLLFFVVVFVGGGGGGGGGGDGATQSTNLL